MPSTLFRPKPNVEKTTAAPKASPLCCGSQNQLTKSTNMSTTLKAVPGTVAISDDEMRRFAPSVFASQPIEGVSERYSFLPTSSILNGMRDNGWVPVRAQEQSIRTEARGGFQKLSEYREESRREAHRAPRRVWGQRHQGRSLWLASARAEPSY